MRQAFHCTVCGIALLAGFAGCGRSGPELAPVSGRVTLDGQPLAGARIMFQPEATGSPSYGATDQEGRYELGYKRGVNGALIGWHVVRIQLDAPGSNDKTNGRPKSLPAQYNSKTELRVEVKDEQNELNFDLTSDAK